MERVFKSLYTIVSLVIVIVVMSVMAMHTAQMYATTKTSLQKEAQAHADVTLSTLQQSIAPFIESYAANEYAKLVRSHMALNAIDSIVVRDEALGAVLGIGGYESGFIRDASGSVQEFAHDNSLHQETLKRCFLLMSENLVSRQTGQKVGSIQICTSDRFINAKLNNLLFDSIISALLVSALLIFALFLTFFFIVLLPIRRLSVALQITDQYGIPQFIPSASGPVEISNVIKTLQNMVATIHQSHEQLSQAHKQLKHEHQRLEDEQARFNLAVQGSRDGLWDWNPQTNKVYFSDQWKRMLGYEPDEIGDALDEWSGRVHPDDFERTMGSVKAYLSGAADIYEDRHRILCKDGSWKWILDRGHALFDSDGTPVRMVGFHTDITEDILHQEELEIARNQAQHANQAKSEFLSSMSHELRTPLNAILGFAQLLEYDPKNPLVPTQRNAVDQILQGGDHMLQVINQVLDLAKIESGKVELEFTNVSVVDVLQDCLTLTQPIAHPRNIRIHVGTGFAAKHVLHTDKTRFKQSLLNLMSNAVKYNRDGGSVEIDATEVSGNLLRISVKDTGKGISEGHRQNLFKPFHRLDVENTDIEGTGIGLTITKQLVERMDGRIGVESEEGVGSIFWIELPISEFAPLPIEDAGHDISAKLPHASGIVLYVEDNPANKTLMEQVFATAGGARLITASTAEKGIEIAKEKRPDLILMDINLPRMSGREALDVLQSLPETKHIPVVALTANAMRHDVDDGLKAGFKHYLTKPIDLVEVINVINKFVS
ncbi:MAG: PAS domain-containing protein [Desulfamplus sp.]|nr:PAS domain-containing protein [Desulfamplus sp.]